MVASPTLDSELFHGLRQRHGTSDEIRTAVIRCLDGVLARCQRRGCELCRASAYRHSFQNRRTIGESDRAPDRTADLWRDFGGKGHRLCCH